MGPVDKDWTTRGTTSSQLILHEMVMTGNVRFKDLWSPAFLLLFVIVFNACHVHL